MDIIVGDARLYYVHTEHKQGWIVHGGYLIANKQDALEYARKTNYLIQRGKY